MNRDTIINKHTTPFKEVKYFHPEGMSMPNGCHYQRGGFLMECKSNKDSFLLIEGMHQGEHKGGFIVFPTHATMKLHDRELINKIEQLITSCSYRVGHLFTGKYIDDNIIYNEQSISVELDELSSIHLLSFAETLANELMQENFLIKNLNNNRIYTSSFNE
jgi:hypothetical protein